MTRASDTAKLLGAGATILDGTTISTADNDPQLTVISTDADENGGPEIHLYRNSASPADNDTVGRLFFQGENDADEKIDYANIQFRIADASDGTEDAKLLVVKKTAGADVSVMASDATETVFNDSSIDMDFRVEGNGDANALFVEGETDNVGVGTNDPASKMTVNTGVNSSTRTFLVNNEHSGGSMYNALGVYVGATDRLVTLSADYGDSIMALQTGGAEMMRISTPSSGVFIGKTSTSASVAGMQIRTGVANGNNIVQDSTTVLRINRQSDDGTLVDLMNANNTEGTISISGGTVSYNAFSGSHWSRLSDNSKPTILVGTVIETIDEMCDWYQAEFIMEEATEDTPEITEKVSIALPDGKSVGDTMSITHEGITYDNAVILKEDDNKHTKCKISDTADSKRVYGVFAAFDNDDDAVNDMYVTAVGTRVVRINKGVTVSGR